MEMELDKFDEPEEQQSRDRSRLNATVAITIALLATFMGICRVKDQKIVKTMYEVQSNKVDYWTWFQARHIREEVAKGVADQLDLQARGNANLASASAAKAEAYRKLAAKEAAKRIDLQRQAARYQAEYDRLYRRDDQFDLSESALSIAIAMLAITALTQKRWLYWLSLIPAAFGVLMGLAGFFNLPIYLEALSKALGP